jgi:hypothetical protein
VKRVKLRGGSVKWTQTRYHPSAESVRQFEENVWKFFRAPSDPQKQDGYYRIKFELHWEPKETAEAYNALREEKEKRTATGSGTSSSKSHIKSDSRADSA